MPFDRGGHIDSETRGADLIGAGPVQGLNLIPMSSADGELIRSHRGRFPDRKMIWFSRVAA